MLVLQRRNQDQELALLVLLGVTAQTERAHASHARLVSTMLTPVLSSVSCVFRAPQRSREDNLDAISAQRELFLRLELRLAENAPQVVGLSVALPSVPSAVQGLSPVRAVLSRVLLVMRHCLQGYLARHLVSNVPKSRWAATVMIKAW